MDYLAIKQECPDCMYSRRPVGSIRPVQFCLLYLIGIKMRSSVFIFGAAQITAQLGSGMVIWLRVGQTAQPSGNRNLSLAVTANWCATIPMSASRDMISAWHLKRQMMADAHGGIIQRLLALAIQRGFVASIRPCGGRECRA